MGRGGATSQQRELFEDYEGFVEKFKPKKTTDDRYTPDEIYEVVSEWVAERYGVRRSDMVRPFWPGGDYESFDYSGGAVVLDNPPFSIISKITAFYLDNGIPFFLFCPSLTAFGGASICMRCCHILCDACIEYENGAIVRTGFVTSYDEGIVARDIAALSKRLMEVMAEIDALPDPEAEANPLDAAKRKRGGV